MVIREPARGTDVATEAAPGQPVALPAGSATAPAPAPSAPSARSVPPDAVDTPPAPAEATRPIAARPARERPARPEPEPEPAPEPAPALPRDYDICHPEMRVMDEWLVGKDINQRYAGNPGRHTLFERAVLACGSYQGQWRPTFNFLLAHGASINLRGDAGQSLLMTWIETHDGPEEMFEELIAFMVGKGLDINARRDDGKAVLSISGHRLQGELGAILRRHGAIE